MAGQTEYRFRPRPGPRRLLPAAAAHRAGRPARADRRLAGHASPAAATPTWPRCSPTTGTPPTRSPARSAWTRARYAAPARARAAPGRPPGLRAARAGRGRQRTSAGPSRCADGTTDRGASGCGIELLATEIAFYRDRDGVPRPAAGTDQLTDARRRGCYAVGEQAGAARAWTLLGQAAWLRADRPAALSCLDRAVELFDELPDSAGEGGRVRRAGPAAHAQLRARAGDRAAAASPRRSPSGWAWSRLRANARITMGTARYQAGDPVGPGRAARRLELCRTPPAARPAPGHPEPGRRAARGGRVAGNRWR